MISVLIPSRGRPQELEAAVRSLIRRAADPESIEILIAADRDDQPTIDAACQMRVDLYIMPERWGYPGLHLYYNELASHAVGDWIFVFNDDTRMCTFGWDDIIHDQPYLILHPFIDYIPEHNSFPIIPGDWVRKLGHVSIGKGTDLWWQALGMMMPEAVQKVAVNIHHARSTDDPTSVERDSRSVQSELDEFNSDEAQINRWRDLVEIVEWLGLPPLDPAVTYQVHFNVI